MKDNWLKDELYRRLSQKEGEADFDMLWQDLDAKRYPKKTRRALWVWGIPFLLLLISSLYVMYDKEVSTGDPSIEDLAYVIGQENKKNEDQISTTPTEIELEPSLIFEKLQVGKLEPPSDGQPSNSTSTASSRSKNGRQEDNENSETTRKDTSTNQYENVLKSDSPQFEAVDKQAIKKETIHVKDQANQKSRGLINLFLIDQRISLLDSPIRKKDGLAEMLTLAPQWNSDHVGKRKHALSISGSYGVMSSHLLSDDSGSSTLFTSEYYEERNRLEKNQDYFDAALNYKYTFDNNVTLQTGISYQQYTAKYQSTLTEISQNTIQDTIAIYMENDLIVDAVIGDIVITKTTRTRSTNFIKYRSFRVPFLVGYDLNISENTSLSLATGVSLGVMLNGNSRLLNPDPLATNYLTMEQSYYEQNLLIESISQLSINRYFYDSWVATVGLKYNRDITNRLGALAGADQKLRSTNFVIGVGKKF